MPDTVRPSVRRVPPPVRPTSPTPPPRARTRLAPVAAAALGACAALVGCDTMPVKRAAYQMLRQEDCRLNQLETFCRRNFANEYHDYERLRRAFMRESSEEAWRAARRAPTRGSERDAAIRAVIESGAPTAAFGAASPGEAAVASALRAVPGTAPDAAGPRGR